MKFVDKKERPLFALIVYHLIKEKDEIDWNHKKYLKCLLED